MPNEKANEKGKVASSKPNHGQDEVVHTFTAPDGTQVQGTQREWREQYRDAGYTRADEPEVTAPGEESPAAPAEENETA